MLLKTLFEKSPSTACFFNRAIDICMYDVALGQLALVRPFLNVSASSSEKYAKASLEKVEKYALITRITIFVVI